MTRIPAIVVAAAAACAAPAFADTVTYTASDRIVIYDVDPATGTYVERSTTYLAPAPAPARTVEYIDRTPVVVASPDPLPVVKYSPAEEIIVTAPRMTEDQAITNDVVDRIASDGRISGRVGVETYNSQVTLTGRVRSPVQAERAGSIARSTPGVRDVNNELRSRMTF